MAGDWIKMRVDLSDNNKVWLMSEQLGVDEFSIIGRLHRVWSWAGKHTKTGTLKAKIAMVDKIASMPGFAEAMKGVGWIDWTDAEVTFPHFDRHNGESAKSRAEARERKRLSRQNKENPTQSPPPDQQPTESSPIAEPTECHANVTTEASQTVTEICDKGVTREEKRREETKEEYTQGEPAKFVPPTVVEVEEFCRESGIAVDAERFVNFYESKGWMVGKNKMQRWKAAVHNFKDDHKPKPGQRRQMFDAHRAFLGMNQ